MRLNQEQINTITHVIHRLTGGTAEVFLFGSRLDDDAKGGDVDLLLESPVRLTPLERARIQLELEAQLGLPVDLLLQVREGEVTAFQRIARASAVRLENGT